MRLKLMLASLLLATASGAHAASAGVFTRQGSTGMNNPGFATATFSTTGQFMTAHASEYRGGVGVFDSAASNSAADEGDHIPQASASGRFVDQMRVGRNDELFELGNGVFALTVKFNVIGGASISQTPAPNGAGMAAPQGAVA